MKIRVALKDPDCWVADAVEDAVEDAIDASLPADMDEDEREARLEKTLALLDKWFEYGGGLEVVFDLDAMTATVVERE